MKRWFFPKLASNADFYVAKAWIPTRKHYKKTRFRKALQRVLEWDKNYFDGGEK